MVFIGSVKALATISLASIIIPPTKIVAGSRMRWSALRIIIRAICGAAIPTKPIGPQKAVIVPAKRVVEESISMRVRRVFKPIEVA